MACLEIIDYLSGLTGFVFDRSVLVRVAVDRGVYRDISPSELDQRTKDLLRADLLLTAYLSPDVMAGSTHSHGSYTKTVGSQTLNNKDDIYEVIVALYRKYGEDDKLALLPEASGHLQWME